jgi:hypothetical protein
MTASMADIFLQSLHLTAEDSRCQDRVKILYSSTETICYQPNHPANMPLKERTKKTEVSLCLLTFSMEQILLL